MTVVANATSEDLSSNATTNWQTKVSASGTLPAGWYNIWTCMELSCSKAGTAVLMQVLLDGVAVNEQTYRPSVANDPLIISPFGRVQLAEGQHSISIQFKTSSASATAYMRRARIMVMKD
jgi:hypothetical protein